MKDDGDEFTVKVFRDSAEWDKWDRWWKMPVELLQELYVCSYTYRTWGAPSEADPVVIAIRRDNPGCILVY